jgi:hypothetical protein
MQIQEWVDFEICRNQGLSTTSKVIESFMRLTIKLEKMNLIQSMTVMLIGLKRFQRLVDTEKRNEVHFQFENLNANFSYQDFFAIKLMEITVLKDHWCDTRGGLVDVSMLRAISNSIANFRLL